MAFIEANYLKGIEYQKTLVDKVEEIAQELGHVVMPMVLEVDAGNPVGAGEEYPTLRFPDGTEAFGGDIEELIQSGRLRKYMVDELV